MPIIMSRFWLSGKERFPVPVWTRGTGGWSNLRVDMILYGADYYPEHWPESRWETDARMMADCGFNVVRVGEFAWSRFEPHPGKYDFAWMDTVLAILAKRGIKAIMGTPTGGVPPWFTTANPDSLIVDAQGRRAGSVDRYFTCFNHKKFVDASKALVEAQVEHYAEDKRVVGWHLHNELGGNRCYCDRCREDFISWLKKQYGSLEEINRRWGTAFWSHVYNEWADIPVPLLTHHEAAPVLQLNWSQYFMDLITRYARLQADIIRERAKGQWISTNIDPHDSRRFQVLDRVGFNNYPHTWDGGDDIANAMRLDAMRAPGARMTPFSFEQRGGQPGWNLVSRLNRPGELRVLAWQAFAHGVDGMTYFRWRIAPFGHENLWGGIVRHDGSFHPHVFPAVREVGRELRRVSPVMEGSRPESPVAIVRTQDCAWAFERQPQQERFSYDGLLLDYYRAGVRYGVNMDVVESREEIERYRVLIMPAHYIMTPALAERLRRYVEKGGVLLMTFRSAVVDDDIAVPGQEAPVWLQDVFGARVEVYDVQEVERYHSRPDDSAGRIRFTRGFRGLRGSAQAHTWYDVLSLNGAKSLAVYEGGFYRGAPAITERHLGKGRALYVGCGTEPRVHRFLFARCAKLAGVSSLARLPEGVEVRERSVHGGVLRFFMNYGRRPAQVSGEPGFTDMLTGRKVAASLRLPAYGVAVLHRPKKP
jgi:beta-galactosidase